MTIALVNRSDALCPVMALTRLLLTLGDYTADTPLFPNSYNQFNSELKRRCVIAGINKEGISTHSLRRGGATALFASGVPEAAIMAHGRWTSLAYRRYIDFDSQLQQLPTALLRQHSSRR